MQPGQRNTYKWKTGQFSFAHMLCVVILKVLNVLFKPGRRDKTKTDDVETKQNNTDGWREYGMEVDMHIREMPLDSAPLGFY